MSEPKNLRPATPRSSMEPGAGAQSTPAASSHIGDSVGGDKIGGDKIGGNKYVFLADLGAALASLGAALRQLGQLIYRHRLLLTAVIALEITLALSFVRFRSLYLIPWGRFVLAAILVAVASVGWSALASGRSWSRLGLAVAASAAATMLVGWQAWQVVYPNRFAPQTFGIVLAELGDGAYFRNSDRSRELSGLVYERLCGALGEAFEQDNCVNSHNGRVGLSKVGIVKNRRTAEYIGKQLQADMVIWGQILTLEAGKVTIRFQVIETPDRASRPDFPALLPVAYTSAEIIADEVDNDDIAQLKNEVAHQATLLGLFTLGLLDFFDQNYGAAADSFENTARRMDAMGVAAENKGLISLYLGRAYNAMGEIDEGQRHLVEANTALPNEPVVALALAQGYAKRGDTVRQTAEITRALELLNDYLGAHPEDTNARYDRGIAFQMWERYQDAEHNFLETIRRDPTHYIAYINLAQVQAKLKRFDDAASTLERAIALAEQRRTNPAWAYLNLGQVYEDAGRVEEARAAYKAAIERNPKLIWAHYFYARFCEKLGETDAAMELYDRLLAVAQERGWAESWAYAKMGDFYRNQMLYEDAAFAYERALALKPDDALARTYLAQTLLALDRRQQALDTFEQALRNGRTEPYVHQAYAAAQLDLRNYAEAERLYKGLLAFRPYDEVSLYNLGLVEEHQHKPDDAKKRYRVIVDNAANFRPTTVFSATQRLAALGTAP
jgi:tetratricopeptide (TPR) repeat protein